MKTNKLILALSSIMIIASCSSRKESSTTGWEYNNAKNGGYETNERYVEQKNWTWLNVC
jgi:uncharacterized lipoprotein